MNAKLSPAVDLAHLTAQLGWGKGEEGAAPQMWTFLKPILPSLSLPIQLEGEAGLATCVNCPPLPLLAVSSQSLLQTDKIPL